MNNENNTMLNILEKAKKNIPKKSYEKKSNAGRKKIADKKSARQVFYNNAEFCDIKKAAEKLGIDSKSFMQMCINQKVKEILEK